MRGGFSLAPRLLGAVGMLFAALPAEARDLISDDTGATARVPSDHRCGESVTVLVDADNLSYFKGDRVALQKLVGGARMVLAFGCENISTVKVEGRFDETAVFEGSASATEDWVLNGWLICGRFHPEPCVPELELFTTKPCGKQIMSNEWTAKIYFGDGAPPYGTSEISFRIEYSGPYISTREMETGKFKRSEAVFNFGYKWRFADDYDYFFSAWPEIEENVITTHLGNPTFDGEEVYEEWLRGVIQEFEHFNGGSCLTLPDLEGKDATFCNFTSLHEAKTAAKIRFPSRIIARGLGDESQASLAYQYVSNAIRTASPIEISTLIFDSEKQEIVKVIDKIDISFENQKYLIGFLDEYEALRKDPTKPVYCE